MIIEDIWYNWNDADQFSGVFSVMDENGIAFEKHSGYRNRSEKLSIELDTAFGIASGTKLFTGLAVCMLIDKGALSLNDKLSDRLPHDMGKIDKRVTVHHLLTHTSGVGDYIDEEAPDVATQMQSLYKRYPVYLWENLDYYLPLITPLEPKFEPGARFGYSNAGYVLLGLIVEAVSGMPYQQFLKNEIILPLNLTHTGFHRMDALPANTALGYIENAPGQLRANIFSLPVRGASDGGLYSCVHDLHTLWNAVFSGRVLSENMLREFLKQHVIRSENKSYGLGVYRISYADKTAYYAFGYDFGVYFFTIHIPDQKITISALGNTETDTFPLLNALLSSLK